MKIYSWQTVNTGNLAEQVCRPTDFFKFNHEIVVMDQDDHDFSHGPVIFGGSGLLYPEIAPILEEAVKNKRYTMIAWGIGTNTHGATEWEYPEWLNKFDLCGLRDYETTHNYVPCPSCMNEEFRDARLIKPSHELVIYDQVDYPVTMQMNGIPRMNNCHPKEKLREVINFLASGKAILTSSYHGVYWGYLLNRNVLIWKPWSTKFFTFKPKPVFVDENNWLTSLMIEQDHSHYYGECVTRNIEFHQEVSRMLP